MDSLYIHFPFCEAKCHYCDFYSLGRERTKTEDPDRFEKALRSEALLISPLLAPVLETIFMGGGTPSMTPPDSMARALEPLWEKTKITTQTEWTMEANPSSISYESFRNYRSLGINRVSMGVQATRPDLLQILGRVHSREAISDALRTVFRAGFENVSVDLLCGVPGQTEKDIEEALENLTQFPITHLSCYLLTLPRHHKMYSALPHEDIQLSHLLFVHHWMTSHGFEHYEVSNYARPGKQAKHNLRYWKGKSYLGLGPSAHSYDSNALKRWKNVSSLHKYSDLLSKDKSPIEWTESLTPEQIEMEKWLLALRLNEGFPAEWLTTQSRRARAKTFELKGLLEKHPEFPQRMRLTPKGFALSDSIIRSLA